MLRTEGGKEEDVEEEEDEEEEAEEEEWKGLALKELCPESERITKDVFEEWKVKFDQEMIEAGVLKRDEVRAKTGKQIFLDIKDTAEADGKDGAKADSKEGEKADLVYNAALFGEADEEDDLDDLSDGND